MHPSQPPGPLVFDAAAFSSAHRATNTGNPMKRLVLASLLTLAGPLGFVGSAHANGDHVATFKNVSGDIGIARNGTTLDAVSGSTLFVSDRIVSGAGSSAGIVFKDGTQLTLGPSTDIQVPRVTSMGMSRDGPGGFCTSHFASSSSAASTSTSTTTSPSTLVLSPDPSTSSIHA